MLTRTALCLALAAAVLTAGCSNDPYPPPGKNPDGTPKKVSYSVMTSGSLKGFDPCRTGDTTAAGMVSQVSDALYEYHYLKRPYELKCALAEDMPSISDDGLVWTIKMKKGITFHRDKCFGDETKLGREATIHDIIYSFKRLSDPANKPRGYWLIEGRIKGLDDFHERAIDLSARNKPMIYAEEHIEGLKALDDFTLQITLTEAYPQFKYVLAMCYLAAVPHEAVEYYGSDFPNHPVGTGPFQLKEWTRRWRMILERNPDYRTDDLYPSEGEEGDREKGLLDDAGKQLPLVDELYMTAVAESQPAWIYFLQGYRGGSGISKDNWAKTITPTKELTPEFKAKGVKLVVSTDPSSYYATFNMEDPLVGGFGEKQRKLRQAMSLAFDTDWRIENLSNGRAISSQGLLPPGIFGYDPDYVNPYKTHDIEKAKKLMVEAGYPDGVDPETGKALEIKLDYAGSGPAIEQRLQVFKDEMSEIGIAIIGSTNTWPEFQRKRMEKKVQLAGGSGWILDYPDPQNFMQLFYGPNKSPGPNSSNYDRKEYNELYEQMKSMEDSPERKVIIDKMVALLNEDCPTIWATHPIDFVLRHQWGRNAKSHGITGGYSKYRDVDVDLRTKLRKEWNKPNYAFLVYFIGVLLCIGVPLACIKRRTPRARRTES